MDAVDADRGLVGALRALGDVDVGGLGPVWGEGTEGVTAALPEVRVALRVEAEERLRAGATQAKELEPVANVASSRSTL